MDTPASPALISLLGALLGVAFGFFAQRSRFCTMGALADLVGVGSWTRVRLWGGATALALLLTTALRSAGLVHVDGHAALAPRLLWLSHLTGGLSFGVGMVLAGGCGSKTLIRLGSGNLKALVVAMALAVSTAMTLRGVLAVPRVAWIERVSLELPGGQDLPALLSALTGWPAAWTLPVMGAALGLAGLAWALRDPELRRGTGLLGLLGVGLAVAGGWWVTGHVGFVADHPETLEAAWIGTNSGRAESFSFSGPYAYALQLLTFWSDANTVLSFGVATAAGVVVGAAVGARVGREWQVESFRSTEDLVTHLIGAALMGFGGVTAVGCSIGQGVTGLSLMSLGAVLTTAAIVTGAWATLKWQESRL